MTEEAITDWDILLPYIGLAKRARINTVTTYSPFELMFGRKMTGPENFITDIAKQDKTQIFQRAIEFKKQLKFD